MQMKVQLVFENEAGGPPVVQEIAQLQRDELSPANLGLTLAESKALLQNLQSSMVQQQVAVYQQQQIQCPHCQQLRHAKDHRSIVYKTLFGKLNLQSTRLFHCDCQPHDAKSFSPLSDLLPERTAPELLYLESKFAVLMSYGLSVQLLAEVLPIDEHLNAETIRNHAQQMANRLESELGDEQYMFVEGCELDWAKLPRPDMPLTVGIDGGLRSFQ